MSVNLTRIGWEDGTLVSPAKVSIGGTVYDVTPEVYSGSTPLSAENLKEMEDNTEDAINDGIIDANTYSTSEIVVGKWINNKPIYRKVVTGVLDGTYTESGFFFTWVATGIQNLDELVHKETKVATSSKIYSEGSEFLKIDYTLSGGYANKVQIGAKSSDIPSGTPVKIILEYTKTTD